VRLHSNRSHARSASSVWDAEGLVQVEVADVSPDVAWAGQTNLHQSASVTSRCFSNATLSAHMQ
jgi:hypothetical protein